MPVSGYVVESILGSTVKGFLNKLRFYIKTVIRDTLYYPADPVDVQNFLDWWKSNWLDKLHYEYNIWDCDDYSRLCSALGNYRTKTNAFGEVIGYVEVDGNKYGHEWVVALVGDNTIEEVWWIEPQTGDVVVVFSLVYREAFKLTSIAGKKIITRDGEVSKIDSYNAMFYLI